MHLQASSLAILANCGRPYFPCRLPSGNHTHSLELSLNRFNQTTVLVGDNKVYSPKPSFFEPRQEVIPTAISIAVTNSKPQHLAVSPHVHPYGYECALSTITNGYASLSGLSFHSLTKGSNVVHSSSVILATFLVDTPFITISINARINACSLHIP